MAALAQEFVPPARPLRRAWTAREDALLRAHYDGRDPASIDALCAVLGRGRPSLYDRAHDLGLTTHTWVSWTPEADAAVCAGYSAMSLTRLAERLGRTPKAVAHRAERLGVTRRGGLNGFTVTEVARIMGSNKQYIVRAWITPGYLAAHAIPWRKSAPAYWIIREAALIRFLREHVARYDWRRMPDPSGYYRRIARQAWEQAGLLTVPEAAARIGVHRSTLHKAAGSGRLPYVVRYRKGGQTWLIRVSDLAAYQAAREQRKGAGHGDE